MTQNEYDVLEAINFQLNEFLNIYTIDVKDENFEYTPSEGREYLATYFLPGSKTQITLGEPIKLRVTGVFQIDVYTPANIGIGKMREITEALTVKFKKGTAINHTTDNGDIVVDITNILVQAGISEDPAWYRKVINVSFRSDILNN